MIPLQVRLRELRCWSQLLPPEPPLVLLPAASAHCALPHVSTHALQQTSQVSCAGTMSS
jgi:hypothetical protein